MANRTTTVQITEQRNVVRVGNGATVVRIVPSSTVVRTTATGPTGPPGPPGPRGEDGDGLRSYTHDQMSAASTWVVEHDLGFRPAVTVIDSGGATCEGHLVHDSDNQLTLTFSAAFAGAAYCS